MRCRINPIPPLPHRNRLAPRGRTDSQRGCGAHTLLDHTTLNLVSKADWAMAFRLDALLQARLVEMVPCDNPEQRAGGG